MEHVTAGANYKIRFEEFRCMRNCVSGIVLILVLLSLLLAIPVTVSAQADSDDQTAHAEEYYLYRLTARPHREMTSLQLEEAGDMENKNPLASLNSLSDQQRYYAAASQQLRMEYIGKPWDSKYYQQQESLLRKRSEALDAILTSPDLSQRQRESLTDDKNIVDNNLQTAHTRYEQAAEAERTGRSSSSSGCLVVTAAFGSPLASEVQLVRDYRDGTIRQSYTGSQFFAGFNAWYYSFSPAVADFVATHPMVKTVMQICLVPLLTIVLLSQNLHAMLGFNPELATVCVLLFGAIFYSLMYILPPAFLVIWLAQRRGWNVPAPGRMKPVLAAWILLVTGLTAGVLLSLDFLAMVASGLLVACTIILVAGTGSMALMQYLGSRAAV
jgi:hypothetical protein